MILGRKYITKENDTVDPNKNKDLTLTVPAP